MTKIWQHMDASTEDSNLKDERLTELLFQFSILLITHVHRRGDPFDLVIVHFTAVMGIRPLDGNFKTAYQYTSFLAGMLWTMRLLLLERALPLKAYAFLQWPARDSYSDQVQRLQHYRHEYLIVGGFHPVGEILSLMKYGRKIAQVEGGRSSISWSADGQELECMGQRITMTSFKQFGHDCLHRAETAMKGLMFDWDPTHELNDIKDDLTKSQCGYSFIQHPDNRLERLHRLLLRRSWSSEVENPLQKHQRWCPIACKQYVEREETFLKDLMLLLHLTGGQPARGPELSTIRVCNGTSSMRNVFIANGSIFFVIEYHKARQSTNHAFHVARYLPPPVTAVFFRYLVYIKPLIALMIPQLAWKNGTRLSDQHLFRSPLSNLISWKSDALTGVLQQKSARMSMKFGISNYRQAAIAITKRHLRSIAKPFNIYDDVSGDADTEEAAWVWQACHRPRQNGTAYALDRAFPTRLQPNLLGVYRRVSVIWHQWLGFSDHPGETPAPLPASLSRKRKMSLTAERSSDLELTRSSTYEIARTEDPSFNRENREDWLEPTAKRRCLSCQPLMTGQLFNQLPEPQSRDTVSKKDPPLQPSSDVNFLRYDPQWRVLICTGEFLSSVKMQAAED